MDLEIIGKKMLEALAIQGQLAGLETKHSSLNAEIVEVGENIMRAVNRKAATLNSLSAVKQQLSTTTAELHEKWAEVEAVRMEALAVEGSVKVIQVRLNTEYSEDAIKQLDTDIHTLIVAKEALQRQTLELASLVLNARRDFETRQAELKVEGVELNIGKRQSKVTVL